MAQSSYAPRTLRSRSEAVVFWVVWTLYGLFVAIPYVELALGWQRLLDWVYAHENLASGLLALAAALIGAYLIHRQISQSDRIEQRRIGSKREAVRAVLPLALSTMTNYAEASGRAAFALLDQCVGRSLPTSGVVLPDVPLPPVEALATLKELVEYLDPSEVRPIALLIADIQVQSARLQDAIASSPGGSRIVLQTNLEECALDAAIVYARTTRLFEFARGATNEVPQRIAWEAVMNALYFFEVALDDDNDIIETILRRAEGDLKSSVPDRWSPSTLKSS